MARRRACGRPRAAPRCCRTPPKSWSNEQRCSRATPSPAFAPASVAGQQSRLLRYGGGGLYAYVPGMHKQVCSCTLDGVTATAPAETADCTRTAPAHPRESRITRAAEECLYRTALTPPRTRRPHTSSPLDNPAVHRAPQMTKFLSAIAYRMRLWLRSPNPCGKGYQNDSTILSGLIYSPNCLPAQLLKW